MKDAYLRKLFDNLSTEDIRKLREFMELCASVPPNAYPRMLAFLDMILDERLSQPTPGD